ncbi:MAG: hypothetical protein K1X53_03975 [Candidatus Sumerlaeaceae bacterium]|nr:hypothetical protein [Candidatus Sumerlaeaceae bacterium]
MSIMQYMTHLWAYPLWLAILIGVRLARHSALWNPRTRIGAGGFSRLGFLHFLLMTGFLVTFAWESVQFGLQGIFWQIPALQLLVELGWAWWITGRQQAAARDPDARNRWVRFAMNLHWVVLVVILLFFELVSQGSSRPGSHPWAIYAVASSYGLQAAFRRQVGLSKKAFEFDDTPLRDEIERLAPKFGILVRNLVVVPDAQNRGLMGVRLYQQRQQHQRKSAFKVPCRAIRLLESEVFTAALARGFARNNRPGSLLSRAVSIPTQLMAAVLILAVIVGVGYLQTILLKYLLVENGILSPTSWPYWVVWPTLLVTTLYFLGRLGGLFPTPYEACEFGWREWNAVDRHVRRDLEDFVLHNIRFLQAHRAIHDPAVLALHVRADRALMRFAAKHGVDTDTTRLVEKAMGPVEYAPRPAPIPA